MYVACYCSPASEPILTNLWDPLFRIEESAQHVVPSDLVDLQMLRHGNLGDELSRRSEHRPADRGRRTAWKGTDPDVVVRVDNERCVRGKRRRKSDFTVRSLDCRPARFSSAGDGALDLVANVLSRDRSRCFGTLQWLLWITREVKDSDLEPVTASDVGARSADSNDRLFA